ncbi:MAG: hypothetical protein ACE5GE_16065 [Phycisphaerae bacterium]
MDARIGRNPGFTLMAFAAMVLAMPHFAAAQQYTIIEIVPPDGGSTYAYGVNTQARWPARGGGSLVDSMPSSGATAASPTWARWAA